MEDRKLFIGGLSWDSKEPQIREYFSKFGEVESVMLKVDQMSGRSRGFAFVVFRDSGAVDQVLGGGEHIMNNKKIDVKRAKARTGKVFVGGLPPDMEESDIRDYFSQFCTVGDIERPYDKARGSHKNFCFVNLEREEALKEILMNPRQTISYTAGGAQRSVEVDVKKVTMKPKNDGYGGHGDGGYGDPYQQHQQHQQQWAAYPASYYGGATPSAGYDSYGYGSGGGSYGQGGGSYGGSYGGYGGGDSSGGWNGYGGGKMGGGRGGYNRY